MRKPEAKEPTREPQIECWRPAGGDAVLNESSTVQPTECLGIAIIPTWRHETFTKAVEVLVEVVGELVELFAQALDHGGESLTDVFILLRSEQVAEMIKGRIDGQLVAGRKL